MKRLSLLTVIAVLVFVGCNKGKDDAGGKPTANQGSAANGSPDGQNPVDTVLEKVNPGQTGKGQDEPTNPVGKIIRTPINSLFRAQDRIKAIQIDKQVQLDKLQNGPYKDAQDYINRVLTPLQIKLPDLGPGERFVFDPETDQLFVEKPAQ